MKRLYRTIKIGILILLISIFLFALCGCTETHKETDSSLLALENKVIELEYRIEVLEQELSEARSALSASEQSAKGTPSSSDTEALQPSSDEEDTIVYVTENGSKYHQASCTYAKDAEPVPLWEARAQGLTPCSLCNPS